MNGDGAFNGHILVDKLAKLNSSQQSIETLSHWCIFHRKKAKQVVETWEQQFYHSPSDQRVSFLYLANDILQNSRRKGMEFVGEFWKVLPNALNDVIENGDEFGRKAALRLVDIWEERKVFNPRGQTLKEDFLGRNRNEKCISYKLKQPTGDMLEKLISSYHHVYDGYDEDTLFGKCKTVISSVEKVEKEIGSECNIGSINQSAIADELKVHHGLLRECIEQLEVAESSRATLVSHLREAINEQDLKLEQLRNQLQVAESRYEQVERLLTGPSPPPPPPSDPRVDEVPPPPPPPDVPPQSLSIPSLDGATEQATTDDACKRLKINNGSPGNLPIYLPQLPLPPFPLPNAMHQPPCTLPSPITTVDVYSSGLPPMQPMLGFPMVGFPSYPGPTNPYQIQGSDGPGFFGQPPCSATSPPVSRQ